MGREWERPLTKPPSGRELSESWRPAWYILVGKGAISFCSKCHSSSVSSTFLLSSLLSESERDLAESDQGKPELKRTQSSRWGAEMSKVLAAGGRGEVGGCV
jgi:hypothetical protein